jgi:hypothetical protein
MRLKQYSVNSPSTPRSTVRPSLLTIAGCCALTVLLASCGKGNTVAPADIPPGANNSGGSHQRSHGDAAELPKSFDADISDGFGHLQATGKEVEVGYVPGPGGKAGMFSLTGRGQVSGQEIEVTVGPFMGLEFKPGPVPGGVGMVTLSAGDNKTEYTSINYPVFYGTKPPAADETPYLEFTKVEQQPANSSFLIRYHFVGTFHFKAAWSPSPPSDACEQEATMAAAKGDARVPSFDAKLCGAKKIEVQGKFDIVQDLLNPGQK